MNGENMVDKLEEMKLEIFTKMVKPHFGAIEPPMSYWHFWKFFVWPKYREMLYSLIFRCIEMERNNNKWIYGMRIIELSTGKTWKEIKGILNE